MASKKPTKQRLPKPVEKQILPEKLSRGRPRKPRVSNLRYVPIGEDNVSSKPKPVEESQSPGAESADVHSAARTRDLDLDEASFDSSRGDVSRSEEAIRRGGGFFGKRRPSDSFKKKIGHHHQ